ncbi:MAG: diaminopimelate epimerase [Deltaproteobacteria bacterium]|nr:diaminopimelate epimerase [Deltaproteobacteria bacterium]
MCGNGLRAAAHYLWVLGGESRHEIVFETDVGLRMARSLGGGMIECSMGIPVLGATLDLTISRSLRSRVSSSRVFSSRVYCVDVGNPHAVVFAHPPSKKKFLESGAAIERHRAFPRRANVEFVRACGRSALDVQVWERGVGETEACGTGAVAAAVAAITKGLVRAGVPVRVKFPGGVAVVSWNGPGSEAFLRGSAALVYSGKIY